MRDVTALVALVLSSISLTISAIAGINGAWAEGAFYGIWSVILFLAAKVFFEGE